MNSPTDNKQSRDATSQAGATRFADARAKQLLAGTEAVLNDPEAHGWEMVKRNASRTVYRGQLGDRGVYLKQFHNRSAWKRLASLAGICDARREFELSGLLKSRGVEAADVLAAAWGLGGGWVLTEAVSPAQDGDRWHRRLLDSGDTVKIAAASRALARLVADMHSAGVVHRDLHCGNVMVCEFPGGKVKPVLMDLHRAARRRVLSRRARAANLAQLCYDRLALTTRTQRLRFLKDYLRFSGAGGSLGGWELLVSFYLDSWAKRHYAHRDRRIGGNNRYFARLKLTGGWGGHAVLATKRPIADSPASRATFTREQWRKTLARPELLLTGENVLAVKDTPSGRVVKRRLSVGDGAVDVFVKLARRRGLLKTLIDCFRPSRALRSFRLGHMLLARGFSTPLPLAAIECRTGRVLLASILIAESSDAPWICDFLQESLGDAACASQAHQALWRAGRTLRRLHDMGMAHRDLKSTNLLFPRRGGAHAEPIFVDLDGLSQPLFMTIRRRLANLTRLEVALLQLSRVTHAGRLRVLLGYLLRPGATRDGFKVYWRVMEAAAAGKMRKSPKGSWSPNADPRRQRS